MGQNHEVLAKARHNEVKKAELKLIQESFENSNEQDSITLVKSVLDERHRREIAELEEKYFFERENIVVSTDSEQRLNALSNWEYRFNQARLKLKQDHYNDLVEYLGKISPSTSQTLQRQNAEKEKKRAQLLLEKEQLDKALEAENEKFE